LSISGHSNSCKAASSGRGIPPPLAAALHVDMKINRRQFVQRTARAALAVGSVEALAGTFAQAQEQSAPLPIVDTHQHLWDLSRVRLSWLKSAKHLERSFVSKDYLEATRGLNVVKAVYMEVAVDADQLLAEAEYVIELCRRKDNPTVAAVIGGRPGEDDFARYITRFKDNPYVKGIRHILPGPGPCHQKEFIRDIRLLGEWGMSFDLCLPSTELQAAAELVDRCPDTRFILDHCGNADPKAGEPWRRDIARLAKRKNVVCKISGIVGRADKESWTAADLAPAINHCLDVFGPRRVMFGGDWPVCTRVASFRQWVAALMEVIQDRDRTLRRNLLHDNAVRFYGLT